MESFVAAVVGLALGAAVASRIVFGKDKSKVEACKRIVTSRSSAK